ncbi:YfhD family protein [Salicibibacter kimchii]|uniref:YfhD family protein n=1 Tax=Salicibibacter kimchii TaxID=2099786 RepID=A0A345C263_9BACI|nr:YfhD family protein [Salicibibacter kimchii]AXF57294.1 YfhD family protein [Salicibibacter kimchii]
MARGQSRNNKGKDKSKLSQTPEHLKETDGAYVEYSSELADHDDIVTRQRSERADQREKERRDK